MKPSAPSPILSALLALTLAATALMTLSSVASAQSVSNGRSLYITPQVSGQLSCGNAQCHSSDPTFNQNRIQNGANNPAAIAAAINGGVSTMAFLRGKLSSTQLADLAAYIANPAATNSAPIATLSSTTLGFGSINIGATSPVQSVTLTNTGAAEVFFVCATVDPSKGYKGITCVVVEKDWGVDVAKKEKKARKHSPF